MKNRARILTVVVFSLVSALPLAAQNASLLGVVQDTQDAVIQGATVTLTKLDTQIAQTVKTDSTGSYEFAIVRPGQYQLKVEQQGFKTSLQSPITLLVDQRGRNDVVLQLGETTTLVTVEGQVTGVQTDTSSLGDVVDTKKIVEIPLNGRFFLDLALLMPGTVVPSTNNRTFLAAPSGIGSSGINASGAREDSTNYLFDGINLSDMVQNQITFQPNIDMIQEFKVQTNSFSAEYGRNAGIIINGVSKSGTNSFHGSAYEFVRNEKFDAKNFFDRADQIIPPFKRNIFGYSIGGPVIRNKTFFFHSYEGREGRESVTVRTAVPSDAQRAAVSNPVIRKLNGLIPLANSADGFFVGSIPKARELNQFSGRIDHTFGSRNFLSGTFLSNRDSRTEPTLQGNNLPGFGDRRPARRYLLSLSYTRIISPGLINELRAGLNRVRIDFLPDYRANPLDFDINSGVSDVFPRILVTGGPAFGGINGFPQGRGDTSFQYTDTVSWVRGKHSFKFGGEMRRFRNNNFNNSIGGGITFSSLTNYLSGVASQSAQTRLAVSPAIRVTAFDGFAQDDYRVTSRLTLNLGLRYELNGVPNEIHDRLSVYNVSSRTLAQAGTSGVEIYKKDFNNFGARLGFSFSPFRDSRTVVRGGFGLYFDQPVTNIVTGLGSNPPFSSSVTFNNTAQVPLNIDLTRPFNLPGGGPSIFNLAAVAPDYVGGYVEQYNFNVQHERFNTVFQAGYVGSAGRHLRLVRDYNQGINSVRPVREFGTINIQESSSNSNYNALWISGNRRFAKGLTFNVSYTFAKSIDLNSVGSSNPQIQNAYNVSAEKALSDFDARHRFVLSGVYFFPFTANGAFLKRAVEGWSIAPIVNLQSGNPFSPIITALRSGSLQAFDRPDLVPGQALTVDNPSPQRWFNTAAFVLNQVGQFGNAGRNILKGPGFQDVDLSLAKVTKIRERFELQFRAEAFNLLNHPNLAQPQNAINAGTVGQITATRTVRGDLGSSRQIQFGIKLLF